MKLLRHALFAFLLLLAQSGALTHGVEHLRVDADNPASHSCAHCIAAQGLDTALVSTASAIAPSTADFSLPARLAVPAFTAAAVSPRARAPPTA